ncbi:MAG: lipopolysaccharide biosynthesis protein, partial [bacterium]
MENIENINEEISLRELIFKLGEWWRYLVTRWLIILIAGMIGGGIGLTYAWLTKPTFKAIMTFALEDDKGSGGGLSGALGLASSLGIDLGTSAGGAFSGANLIELMKSRKMVQKALLSTTEIGNRKMTLGDMLLDMTGMKQKLVEKGTWVGSHFFNGNTETNQLNLQQDSVMKILHEKVT